MVREGRKRGSGAAPADPTRWLERFDELYEAGQAEAALGAAEDGLRKHPEHAALHHARGLALWALGRGRTAAEALDRSIRLDPSQPDPYLDLASLRIDALGDPAGALDLLRSGRRALRTDSLRAATHTLRARAYLDLDDPRAAEKELRRARRLAPEDADLATELAEVRLEVLDFRGADEMLDEAMRLDPSAARPHWLRAVLRDRDGDRDAAEDGFRLAARIDPQAYFVPERLDDAEFDLQVEKALAAIPARFRRHLENTEIAVEPYPTVAFLREHDMPPTLLGMFLGTPLTLRTFDHADLPPRILIFQRNLENVCRTRRELVREIGITVRHEIGHLLGMEEDELEDAGHA